MDHAHAALCADSSDVVVELCTSKSKTNPCSFSARRWWRGPRPLFPIVGIEDGETQLDSTNLCKSHTLAFYALAVYAPQSKAALSANLASTSAALGLTEVVASRLPQRRRETWPSVDQRHTRKQTAAPLRSSSLAQVQDGASTWERFDFAGLLVAIPPPMPSSLVMGEAALTDVKTNARAYMACRIS